MTQGRPPLALLLAAALIAQGSPAAAQAGPGTVVVGAETQAAPGPSSAAQKPPSPAPETADHAYRRGFQDGVDAVNAQLGAVTARLQSQVQDQVNAQLATIEAEHRAELARRLAAAQRHALDNPDATPATAARPLAAAPAPTATPAAGPAMPHLPPLVVAPGGGIAPRRADPSIPRDPAALPSGTTITITDPQNLPPDLFRALLDYLAR